MVVEQGDIKGVIAALHRMKESPFLVEDCRKRAERCFDKNKCFKEYIELYKHMV